MQRSTARAFLLLTLIGCLACTENQDLGDRGEGGDGDVGDGDGDTQTGGDGDGDGKVSHGDGDGATDSEDPDEIPQAGDGDGDGEIGPEDPDGGMEWPWDVDPNFGKFGSYTPARSGFSQDLGLMNVSVTSVRNELGCALVGDDKASAGRQAALAMVVVESDLDEYACPEGVHPVIDDIEKCKSFDGLRVGCALYKRWDDAGKQVAALRGVGGYVSIERVGGDTTAMCSVKFSVSFGEGHLVEHEFSVPVGAAVSEAACTP